MKYTPIIVGLPLLGALAYWIASRSDPCPLDFPQPMESRPQSPYYRAGCLEPIAYVTEEGGRLRAHAMNGARTPDGETEIDLDVLPSSVDRVSIAGKMMENVQLYEVKYQGINLCEKEQYDPMGLESGTNTGGLTGKAIRVPGYWKDGTWQDPNGKPVYTYACASGVVAKCTHWGYVPWVKNFPGPGQTQQDLGPYHRACVFAARAIYIKTNDTPYTCRNTKIDIYDRLGIQKKSEASLIFESSWNANGLLCMSHSRWQGCNQRLTSNGVMPSGPCVDPVQAPGQLWAQDVQPEALIAVASSAANGKEGEPCPPDNWEVCSKHQKP